MPKKVFFMVLATLAFMLVAGPSLVNAGYEELFGACESSQNLQLKIDACSQLVEGYSNRLSREAVGYAYVMRGHAKSKLGQDAPANSDYHRANNIFRQLCDRGDGAGCFRLGQSYLGGYGVPKSQARGFELADKACGFGFAAGCW